MNAQNPDQQRRQMLKQLVAKGIQDGDVLDAMGKVPREAFVLPPDRNRSYDDRALPIDGGQTISQPYMVAVMTEYLDLFPKARVLEIGTGSGYQTAVLAELAGHVTTVERIARLSQNAKTRLDELGYNNVDFHVANGAQHFKPLDAFDRIIVTAGCEAVPPYLLRLLSADGILVAPVGPRSLQQLITLRKSAGKFLEEAHFGCRFVPLLDDPVE